MTMRSRARHTATVVLAMLMLMALTITAVAASDAQASPLPAATSTSVPAAGGCPTHGLVACVDRTDGGHTVHLRVGHVLKVQLGGSALRWSGLHQVGPDLLRRSGGVVERNGGITATYRAVKAGRTTLRAGGAPKCAPGHACPQFILLWQVRVVIG
jgi:hypothetical protein